MNRRLPFALGLLLITGSAAEEAPTITVPWPATRYSEVRAYLYHPGENPDKLILREGKLHPEVVNPEGIKLDATQVAKLLQTIRHHEPDGHGGCFLPHHGIVFHNSDGVPAAALTICFLCKVATESPSGGDAMDWDLPALAKLVQDLGLPVFKTFDEAEDHFIALARQWPDAKVKDALDKYLLHASADLLPLIQGLGERTHPLLLAYLAERVPRDEWLKKDRADPFPASRFHRLCDAFGDIPPASAIPLLAPFLDDQDASTRCDAAITIAKTGASEIIPLLRKALSDSERDVALNALAGLQVAIDRGALHADTKAQLFADVKGLSAESVDEKCWARALVGLDSNKALEFFLSDENFTANSARLRYILETLCEINLQVPRERLLALAAELRAQGIQRQERWIMEPALLLLGRQHHPDDLELLSGTGDPSLAGCAMPGLLAWHGLEGYRERLSKLEEEKGFAALNEVQRVHFAARKFESAPSGIGSYFSGSGGDQWRDALAGLKAMQRNKLAAILEEAVAKFGAEGPSGDQETRRVQLDLLTTNRAFDDLDRRRNEAENPWSLALDRYAIEHAESFK